MSSQENEAGQQRNVDSQFDQAPPKDSGDRGRRYVIRGGAVMSMDPQVGNFEVADVLVEGKEIVAVRPGINAAGADVIDARGRIVMPGFVDTHHHLFETAERAFLANGLLLDDGSGSPSAYPNYGEHILEGFARVYRPQDVYINELLAGLSQSSRAWAGSDQVRRIAVLGSRRLILESTGVVEGTLRTTIFEWHRRSS